MTRPSLFVIAYFVCQATTPNLAVAEERFVERNGLTYRETEGIERRPVTRSQWVETEETVMRNRYVTEMRDSYRTVYSPVTEYRPEPRWHNLWIPFARPYIAIHMRPTTYWETRYQRHQTPVTYREVVPETRTVRRLERTPGFVEERVVRREPVHPQSLPQNRIVRRPARSAMLFESEQLKDGSIPRQGTTMR